MCFHLYESRDLQCTALIHPILIKYTDGAICYVRCIHEHTNGIWVDLDWVDGCLHWFRGGAPPLAGPTTTRPQQDVHAMDTGRSAAAQPLGAVTASPRSGLREGAAGCVPPRRTAASHALGVWTLVSAERLVRRRARRKLSTRERADIQRRRMPQARGRVGQNWAARPWAASLGQENLRGT